MNNVIFYSRVLITGKPGLEGFVNAIQSRYGGGIFAEISIDKDYRSNLTWQLEYIGGLPTSDILFPIFKNIIKTYVQKLNTYISRPIAFIEKLEVLENLIVQFRGVVKQYEGTTFPGNIILAKRNTNKLKIKKYGWSVLSGKFQQKPAPVELLDKKNFKIIRQELTPVQVMAELSRHKSARSELFQSLLEKTETCRKELIKNISKANLSFQFTGNTTTLVRSALALLGTDALRNYDGSSINNMNFIRRYLGLFGRQDADIRKAIQNIIDSPTDHRFENQFLKCLKKGIHEFLN